MKTAYLALLCALLFVGGTALPLHAQDLGAIRGRMEQRLSQLDQLKAKGAIGENNRGLVEVRTPSADTNALAEAENKDRSAVYAALAQKTGASPDNVGAARAKQIAGASAPGVWLQRENGEWYQK